MRHSFRARALAAAFLFGFIVSQPGFAQDMTTPLPQDVITPEADGTTAPQDGAETPPEERIESLLDQRWHHNVKLMWRVENPFRFFKNPDDTAEHMKAYVNLSEEQRRTPVVSAERVLSALSRDGWSAKTYMNTCWDSGKNQHGCPTATDYINPKSHAVVVSLNPVDEPDALCVWSFAAQRKKDRKQYNSQKTVSCSAAQPFEIPYPNGGILTVHHDGLEIARDWIKVRDVLIAGVGDSFASGEGNPDVPVRFSPERTQGYGVVKDKFDLTGYPTRIGSWKRIGDKSFNKQNAHWNDTACHRSLYSHQLRSALQLSLEDPHRAVTYLGFSCSGAAVTWGLFLRYKGNEWVPNPPNLSQISALAEAQCGSHTASNVDMPEAYHIGGVIKELQGGLVLRKCDRKYARKIDLLLVSVGGNDIGFARLVANAVLSDQSLLKKLGGWFGQLHEKEQTDSLLSAVDERLKALNRAVHGNLHMSWDQSDRVILTAYPPLALLGDKLKICPSGNAGMDVLQAFSLSEERALTSTLLATRLNDIMLKSANLHGWSFADAHRQSFVGRGICAGIADGRYAGAEDLRMPRKTDEAWVPFNPADYNPYETRRRWFRTPNDAYLTAHFHATGTILRQALSFNRLSWFQVLLASTYSGAFHPNAEGQAAIADSVTDIGRRVLQKYGQ